jgi:RNA polymerase sigma factor for flagellar operon FliA
MTNEELWIKYKDQKSKEAKEELIIQYVSLVKIIAGRLFVNYNAHVEYDDLMGYGIIGLIDAIEKFDHKKNIKFETYANIRIRGAIIDEIRHLDWIPRSVRQKYKRIEEAISKLQVDYGFDIPDEVIASSLDLTVDEYHKLLGEVTTYSVVSLEEKINESTRFDIKSSKEEFEPETHYIDEEMKETLSSVIDKLPEKESMVLQLYYYSELTYKEIADILGVSESRISQIHTKAITKLKITLSEIY